MLATVRDGNEGALRIDTTEASTSSETQKTLVLFINDSKCADTAVSYSQRQKFYQGAICCSLKRF